VVLIFACASLLEELNGRGTLPAGIEVRGEGIVARLDHLPGEPPFVILAKHLSD
jgi:hypothetical protein